MLSYLCATKLGDRALDKKTRIPKDLNNGLNLKKKKKISRNKHTVFHSKFSTLQVENRSKVT